MAPSRELSPADDTDVFASAKAAMLAETPPPTPHCGRKRTRTQRELDDPPSSSSEDDDTREEDPPSSSSTLTTHAGVSPIATNVAENVVAFARRSGPRKGLRGEQQSELEEFAGVSVAHFCFLSVACRS